MCKDDLEVLKPRVNGNSPLEGGQKARNKKVPKGTTLMTGRTRVNFDSVRCLATASICFRSVCKNKKTIKQSISSEYGKLGLSMALATLARQSVHQLPILGSGYSKMANWPSCLG